jgi:hypothetical protein
MDPSYPLQCDAAWNTLKHDWSRPAKRRLLLFQMQTIRLVTATFLIAKRKSMNWTPKLTKHKLPALVGA